MNKQDESLKFLRDFFEEWLVFAKKLLKLKEVSFKPDTSVWFKKMNDKGEIIDCEYYFRSMTIPRSLKKYCRVKVEKMMNQFYNDQSLSLIDLVNDQLSTIANEICSLNFKNQFTNVKNFVEFASKYEKNSILDARTQFVEELVRFSPIELIGVQQAENLFRSIVVSDGYPVIHWLFWPATLFLNNPKISHGQNMLKMLDYFINVIGCSPLDTNKKGETAIMSLEQSVCEQNIDKKTADIFYNIMVCNPQDKIIEKMVRPIISKLSVDNIDNLSNDVICWSICLKPSIFAKLFVNNLMTLKQTHFKGIFSRVCELFNIVNGCLKKGPSGTQDFAEYFRLHKFNQNLCVNSFNNELISYVTSKYENGQESAILNYSVLPAIIGETKIRQVVLENLQKWIKSEKFNDAIVCVTHFSQVDDEIYRLFELNAHKFNPQVKNLLRSAFENMNSPYLQRVIDLFGFNHPSKEIKETEKTNLSENDEDNESSNNDINPFSEFFDENLTKKYVKYIKSSIVDLDNSEIISLESDINVFNIVFSICETLFKKTDVITFCEFLRKKYSIETFKNVIKMLDNNQTHWNDFFENTQTLKDVINNLSK